MNKLLILLRDATAVALVIALFFAIFYLGYRVISKEQEGTNVAAMSCVLPSSHVLNFDKVRKIITKKDNEIYFELMSGERVALNGNYTCVIKEAP